MKTSVEISDPLFEDAKKHAAEGKTTLRELIERGLRLVLAQDRQQKTTFAVRDASVDGNGLKPEFRGADWDQIRNAAYEDHGG